jgi:hypothetical protein
MSRARLTGGSPLSEIVEDAENDAPQERLEGGPVERFE